MPKMEIATTFAFNRVNFKTQAIHTSADVIFWDV